MPNKYLLGIVCGLLFPILFYLLFYTLKQSTVVSVPQFGLIQDVLFDAKPVALSTKQSATTTFVGDVLLARNVEFLMRSRDIYYPFKNVPALFSDSTTVVGNFESAVLQHHTKTPSFNTTFSVASEFLPLLTKSGFTHFSLANNHSLDYGSEAFVNTEMTMQTAGLQVFGNPQQVATSAISIIPSGDYTIGLIAINQIFSNIPWTDVVKQIETLSKNSDFQIAYVHWGTEYNLKHNANQEAFAKKLIDSGIDAIVGHHPHVTQDIQIYNNKPIFYSLGNFIFDQYFSVDVQQGLMLKLNLSHNSAIYTLTPISSEGYLSQPYKMAEREATLFLKNVARRSDPNYTQNIQAGLLILPFDLATSAQTSTIVP